MTRMMILRSNKENFNSNASSNQRKSNNQKNQSSPKAPAGSVPTKSNNQKKKQPSPIDLLSYQSKASQRNRSMSTTNEPSVNVVSVGSSGATSAESSTTKAIEPPTTIQVPTSAIAALSPVTTKSKGSSKSTKPLTVTVNGIDRSKDLNRHDVVCKRGRGDHQRWPGNELYRDLINININEETYNDLAPIERSNIIDKIISTIQEKEGWFVHHSEETGNWAKLTEEKARKKVSEDLGREARSRRKKRVVGSLAGSVPKKSTNQKKKQSSPKAPAGSVPKKSNKNQKSPSSSKKRRRCNKQKKPAKPLPISLDVVTKTIDKVLHVYTEQDTDGMTALLRMSVPEGARRLIKETCEKLFPDLMDQHALGCAPHLSPFANEIKKPTLCLTVPTVYAKYTDSVHKKLEKIGMAMQIKKRYKRKKERACLFPLFSLGMVTEELDEMILKHQKNLIEALIGHPEIPVELKAFLNMFDTRKAGDLGPRKNLYVQLVECVNQEAYGMPMPCEALSCDVKGIQARLQLALDCVNAVLPGLLNELKTADGAPLRVTNDNLHCTSSWKTGAHEDRLSSNIVAINYISGNAAWDDTLPALAPDGDSNGKRTAATIYKNDYTKEHIASGQAIVNSWLDKCVNTFRMELLDQNSILYPGDDDLALVLKDKGFVCKFVILKEIQIWVHPTTKSVVVVHPPVCYAMDSRTEISMEVQARRFILIEILHLLTIGLKERKEEFTMEDIPKNKNAIFASYVYESTKEDLHQNKFVAWCAIARDVLTPESINACTQNALRKAGKEVGVCSQRRDRINQQRHKTVDKRAYDRFKQQKARNRCSFHGVDKSRIKLPMGKTDPSATISELTREVDQILEGTNGIQNHSKNVNFRNFLKNGSVMGNLRKSMKEIREKELVAVGAAVKKELCNSGDYFWVRQCSVPMENVSPNKKPTPVPRVLPNFSEIDATEGLANNKNVSKQFVDRFVDELVTYSLRDRRTNPTHYLKKYYKIYADEDGQVIHRGAPHIQSPPGFGADRSANRYPQWLVYVLCQMLPRSETTKKNKSKQK